MQTNEQTSRQTVELTIVEEGALLVYCVAFERPGGGGDRVSLCVVAPDCATAERTAWIALGMARRHACAGWRRDAAPLFPVFGVAVPRFSE